MASNFHKGLMMSEVVPTKLVTGVFQASGADAAVEDGALVVIGGLRSHDTYDSTTDLNTHNITAPTALTNRVAVVDYVGVPSGTIGGNLYRDGYKTFGLTVPAGTATRTRILELDDTGFWATGNFVAAPTVGQYAVLTANSVKLTAAASKPATGFCVRVDASKPVTEGTVNTETEYFCTVVQL